VGFTIRVVRSMEKRFPTEWEEFQSTNGGETELGFVIWLGDQPKYKKLHRKITHSSENSLNSEKTDFVIKNNSSIVDLAKEIKQILIDKGIID